MDRSQVRWALLKISLVALGAMTWVSAGFVLETRPDAVLVAMNDRNSVSPHEDALATLVRLPASLPAVPAQIFAPTARTIDPIQMEVVKLSCWDMGEMQPQSVDARWVRFTGRPCQSDSTPENIEVINTTNGYVGTVFAAQRDLMTTDFIPLQEGPNEILMKLGHEGGVIFENRFTFNKQPE